MERTDAENIWLLRALLLDVQTKTQASEEGWVRIAADRRQGNDEYAWGYAEGMAQMAAASNAHLDNVLREMRRLFPLAGH